MTVERAIAVIDGITYDTAQAATVAWVYDEHSLESGYEGIKRRLMHQANGKFFLFELLGTLQKHSMTRIIPLADSEALRWCESNGVDTDTIARHFSFERRSVARMETLSLLTSRWATDKDSRGA